ncbi:MAG: YceI family protein [Deltaproteobacteria bacterium]|nr:YceI family protein [Deltaproteobacteria bacterium]
MAAAFAVLFLTAVLAFPGPGTSRAETIIRYESVPGKSRVVLSGKSTLHDWGAESTVIHGRMEVRLTEGTDLPALMKSFDLCRLAYVDVKVAIPITSLRADSEELEERMCHKLNYEKHPKIHYAFDTAEQRECPEVSEYMFDTMGKLTVNGVTRPVAMNVIIQSLYEGQLYIQGSTFLKMTDFNIKPPSLLCGIVKADDEIRIHIWWAVRRVDGNM